MNKVFGSIKGLVGDIYDLLFDAATKVWSLVKPVLLIGLVLDLVTGKLGWINQIVAVYKQLVDFTSGASLIVLIIAGVLLLTWINKE